jgi:hypothetical protein
MTLGTLKAIYNIPNQLCNAQLILLDSFVARFNIIVILLGGAGIANTFKRRHFLPFSQF